MRRSCSYYELRCICTVSSNKDGLIHISKLSKERVEKVEDVVNIGDKVKVKVLEIDKMEN